MFHTCTPASLRQLLDTVGISQVVIGTDYPFDMGHYDVHGLIAAVPGLTDSQRAESTQALAQSGQAPDG